MVQVQAKRVGNEHLVHHDYFIARLLFSSSFLSFFLIGGCLRVEGKRISFFSFLWKKIDTFGSRPISLTVVIRELFLIANV